MSTLSRSSVLQMKHLRTEEIIASSVDAISVADPI